MSGTGLPVNVWLVRHGERFTLVDAGFPSTADELVRQLGTLGVELPRVERVVLTHTHEDHIGGAVVLDQRWDAVVTCCEHAVGIEPNWYDAYDAMPLWSEWLAAFLPEGEFRERVLERRARRPVIPIRQGGDGRLRRVERVPFGGTIRVGDETWTCVDARGHDPGHCAWDRRVPGREAAVDRFTGDVLLGIPTPILPPMGDDLSRYRRTLMAWLNSPMPTRALPGHGRAIADMRSEVERSLDHMRTLWQRTTDALAGADDVDPGLLALGWVGRDDPRRLFIQLGNLHSQLLELQRLGLAERDPDSRRWRSLGDAPSFDDHVAALAHEDTSDPPA